MQINTNDTNIYSYNFRRKADPPAGVKHASACLPVGRYIGITTILYQRFKNKKEQVMELFLVFSFYKNYFLALSNCQRKRSEPIKIITSAKLKVQREKKLK